MADILQKKYLQDKLVSVARNKEHEFKGSPKPQRVRDAEKVLNRWERMHSRNRQRFYARIQNMARQIKEMILFGDPHKALKALKDFEAKSFK